MDDDDQSAAEAHQMELEQREREEEALARGRQVLAAFRRDNVQFDTEMEALNKRVSEALCKVL